MKKIIFNSAIIVFASLCYLNLGAQQPALLLNANYLKPFEKNLKDSILSAIYAKENSGTSKSKMGCDSSFTVVKVDSFKIFPLLKLDFYTKADLVLLNKIIFNDSSDMFVLVYPCLKTYLYSNLNHACKKIPNNKGKEIINRLMNFNGGNLSNISFCYLLETQKQDFDILIDLTNPHFFGYNLNKFVNLNDLILHKYGSVDQFEYQIIHQKSMIYYQQSKDSIVNSFNIPLNYKSYVKSAWKFRNEIFPKDTVANIRYLIATLKNNIQGITNSKLDSLSTGVYKLLQNRLCFNSTLRSMNSDTVMLFMNINILPFIESILNDAQFISLKKYWQVQIALEQAVIDYIFMNLNKLADWTILSQYISSDDYTTRYQKYLKEILTGGKILS